MNHRASRWQTNKTQHKNTCIVKALYIPSAARIIKYGTTLDVIRRIFYVWISPRDNKNTSNLQYAEQILRRRFVWTNTSVNQGSPLNYPKYVHSAIRAGVCRQIKPSTKGSGWTKLTIIVNIWKHYLGTSGTLVIPRRQILNLLKRPALTVCGRKTGNSYTNILFDIYLTQLLRSTCTFVSHCAQLTVLHL